MTTPRGSRSPRPAQQLSGSFLRGCTPDGERSVTGPNSGRRFAYLPLPPLERRGTGVVTAIRRVLVVGPPGGDPEVGWVRVLSSRELTPPDSHRLSGKRSVAPEGRRRVAPGESSSPGITERRGRI